MHIPYFETPGHNACAVACHQMTARAFFPDVSIDEIQRICRWEEGYVVWGFPFWLWMMDRGIKILEYDPTDYKAWAEQGIDGLKTSLSQTSIDFVMKWTKDIDAYTEEIKACFSHPNFTHIHRPPLMDDLKSHCGQESVCEIVLESRTLNKKEGFSLHRVVALKLSDDKMMFHDPTPPDGERGENRQVSKALFQDAWRKGEELCVYKRKDAASGGIDSVSLSS